MVQTDIPDDSPASTRTTVPSLTGRTYFPIAFLARFPFAMMVVGTLTLIVAARHSIGFAGVNSAVVGLGGAIGGPLIGAAADRHGQRPVILAAGAANGLLLIALAWIAYSSAPDYAVLIVSFFTGGTVGQTGPLSRSRLVQIIGRQMPKRTRIRAIERTMAYESAADEVTFVFGPVLVGVLATTMGAAAAMVGAAAMTAVFVTAFALHRTVHFDREDREAGRHRATRDLAPVRELFRFTVVLLTIGSLVMGLVFGSTLTALIAFMGDLGNSDAAGLAYGVLGVGSAILALACAVLPGWFTQGARWIFFAALLAVGAVVFAMSSTMPGIVLGLALTGLGAGPTLVTIFSLTAERAPAGRYSTAMTMVGSAITVGQAASSAITGQVAELSGTQAALWLPAISAAAVLLTGLANAALFGARRFRRT